jgi:hypothetical protein
VLIVPQSPPLFEAFRAKCFNLLWRGSRDRFTAQKFHLRCDGRANTLTLISDTDGTMFGGFTPVKWGSSAPGEENGHDRGDDSLRSFLVTLRNPHGAPPRRFTLKAEKKQSAIYCHSALCADFGYSGDIYVSNHCNANKDSVTGIGTHWSNCAYANDTASGTSSLARGSSQ